MRRILLLLTILTLAAWQGKAQSMQGYEYWFDDDYTARTAVTSDQPDISFEVDYSGLLAGLHYLNFRAQGSDGQWGALSRMLVYLTADSRGSTDMVAYEYWMDSDYANRTSVAGSGVQPFAVDVSNLQTGLHYLNFRAQGSDGQWGALSRMLVYLTADLRGSTDMVAYEYWMDSDYANRTAVSGTAVDSPITLDVSNLQFGLHYFNFRAQGSDGQWGALSRYIVYLSDAPSNNQLANVAYWIDDNTSERQYQQVNDSIIVISTDISNLSVGYHFLNIEGLASSDAPCMLNSYEFVVSALPVLPDPVISHEGNIIIITITTAADSTLADSLVVNPTYYYTLDGTMPDTTSIKYVEPFEVTHNCVVKAIAVQRGFTDSKVDSLVVDWFKVEPVEFAQNGRKVTLATATDNASIYYKIGEGDLDVLYTDTLTLDASCTIRATAKRDGYSDADLTTFEFNADSVRVAKPTIVANGNKVGISTTTEQATIYYTLDGTTPTTQSPVYIDSITVERNCIVKAIAMRQNWFDSEVDSLVVDWIVIGDASFDGLVATVSGERTLDEAFDSAGGRREAAKTIAAIIWDKSTPVTESDLQDIDNPNLLVYVADASLAPTNINNVIVNGTAKSIVLTDAKEGNNNFFVPQAFTAERVSYTRDFQQETQVGVVRGWESIALPFDVQTVSHATKGVIAPFGNDASTKHFWLRRLGSSGLHQATRIEANVPYVISMPNDAVNYLEEFNLSGKVTFSAVNVTIPVTEPVTLALADSTIMMVPAFQRVGRSSEVWALNVGEARSQYFEGSTFERDYREVRPFEAYTVHNGNGPAPRFVPVKELNGGTTDIESLTPSLSEDEGVCYDLNGRKVSGFGIRNSKLQKGVYIQNGRKRVIK